MNKQIQKNVFGEPLEPCSNDPITGWFRDGCCNTDKKNVKGKYTKWRTQLTRQMEQ